MAKTSYSEKTRTYRKADTPVKITTYEELIKGLGATASVDEVSALLDNDSEMRVAMMLLANEKGLYAGNDPEAFHQMLSSSLPKKKKSIRSGGRWSKRHYTIYLPFGWRCVFTRGDTTTDTK